MSIRIRSVVPGAISIFSLLFLSVTVLPTAKNRVAEEKFNLLLITIDTLRADRLSCYNPEHVKTPNIDSLAVKSTIFTRTFAHASTTLPSHTNILLGATPVFHGVHDNFNFRVKAEHLTLAEFLKERGYSTGAFVGAFPLDSIYGLSQGFDTYDDNFGLTSDGKQAAERPAELVLEKALEFIAVSDSPWFVWIHCYDPHDPYEPPHPFRTDYKTNPYEGEVAYVDFALKKLFQYLESNKLYERTVVVFTGDHGESLGEHGEKTHSFFAYNSTIWVPLFIYIPGMKHQIINQNVSHIDLFPTICDALRIEKPSLLEGSSLLPFKPGKKQERRTIYFESLAPYYSMGWAPIRGIIQGQSKFIDSPLSELYDLSKDFNEKRDLSRKNNLDGYRKQLVQILQRQISGEKTQGSQVINREALEKLRSFGYVGDYLGETKKSFGVEDDVKTLLPYYNQSKVAHALFYEEGKAREAIDLLREIISEKKRFPDAFLNLALIYKDQGRLEDAIQILRTGLDAVPESYQLFSTLLDYLYEAGQWNDIIGVFLKMSYERFEFDPVIWNLVGTAYSNLGDFKNALMCCERAVLIDEAFPISYNNLGRIHFSIYNLSTDPETLEKALRNYQKAVELDPSISTAHYGLGLIFMHKVSYDKAISHLETALKLQPDFDYVLYHLGLINLKKGEKAKAISFFIRFKNSKSYGYLPSTDREKLEAMILQCRDDSSENMQLLLSPPLFFLSEFHPPS